MSLPSYTQKISAEAGAWLARLQGGPLSAADESAFQAWLGADRAHAAAFEHATNIWERLGGVPRELYVPKKPTFSVPSRRALVFGAVSLAVFGAAVPFMRGARAQNYQTVVGEQSRVRLADGSELFLDTNTNLNVDLDGTQRLVDLQYGRIACQVAHNERPFAVKTGDCLIMGDRSVFDVSNSENVLSVVLITGNAEVTNPASGSIRLTQGERAMAAYAKPFRRDRPDLSLLTAWQTGRLVFRDETVSDAVRDMNRYSVVKIEVEDSGVGSLRISGGYAVGDSQGFVGALSRLLPIDVRQEQGRIRLVRRSDI